MRDFRRMNVRINGDTCTDARDLKPILKSIGLPRVQKQFLSSICQTSMSEPLLILQKLVPNLICAECNFREPLDVNIYRDKINKTIQTVSFKKLRMIREEEITSGVEGPPRNIEIMVTSRFRERSKLITSKMSVMCSKDSAVNILKAIICADIVKEPYNVE